MNLFPKDYEHLKELIDKAIQRNQETLHFKGVRLFVHQAKKMYQAYAERIKEDECICTMCY